jgi:putative SOS response-associated peptidase YedK
VPANDLVGQIHDRMPLILPKSAYERWLGLEPDPGDLLTPFPAELMVMWPVSTRVNSPDNDDSSLIDPDRELSAFRVSFSNEYSDDHVLQTGQRRKR